MISAVVTAFLSQLKKDNTKSELPQVTITSNSHIQLAQIHQELESTQNARSVYSISTDDRVFHRLTGVTLAGRKHLCINQAVNEQATVPISSHKLLSLKANTDRDRDLTERCLGLLKHRGCRFQKSDKYGHTDLEDILSKDSLRGKCLRYNMCPYFETLYLSNTSDVLLAPTANLFGGPLGDDKRPKIVFVDECHRLDSAVRSTYSFECEIEQIVPDYVKLFRDLRDDRYFDENQIVVGRTKGYVLLTLLHSFLKAKSSEMNAGLPSDISDVSYIEVSVEAFHRYLSGKMCINDITHLLRYLKKVLDHKKQHFYYVSRWIKFWTVIQKMFILILRGCEDTWQNDFFCALTKKSTGPVVFHFICLRGKIPLRDLVKQRNIKSLILVSGTYDRETAIEQFGFENLGVCSDPTVSPANQVRAFCITHFSDDSSITCTKSYFNLRAYATLITRIGESSAGNTLVFTPSYVVCQQLESEFVNQQNLPFSLVVESDNRHNFNANEGGVPKAKTVVLAVMRGKLAEGVNLPEGSFRSLVIVGLPIPRLDDPYVRKKQSLDASFTLKDAMVAVNQAIGRLYRGRKNDGGSVIFLDYRYSQPDIRARLPAWCGVVSVREEEFLNKIQDSNLR
jgi:Rad3-related DNA helicase